MKTKIFMLLLLPLLGKGCFVAALLAMTSLGGGLFAQAPTNQMLTVAPCTAYTVPSAAPASSGATYQWLENGMVISGATGAAYSNTAGKAVAGRYEYIRQAKTANCTEWMNSNVFVVQVTAGTRGETFSDFVPCSNTPNGTVWSLEDSRDGKTYKVKQMADGRIWMVQDLKFGNCANDATTTWYNDNSQAATTHTPTVAVGYVGHCRATNYTNSGYLYSWAAAVQSQGGYNGGTYTGCSTTVSGTSGAAPGACKGICPDGWHLPTKDEFQALYAQLGNASNSTTANNFGYSYKDIDAEATHWHGVLGGTCNSDGSLNGQGSYALYWSSTYYSSNDAYNLNFNSSYVYPASYYSKYNGQSVRCVRNY
jgi:uncharacterized protein (TIGR02145 family)